MIILPFPDLIFSKKDLSKFGTNTNLDGFKCIIKEVNDTQAYQIPSHPRDDNQSQNDTIYRMPRMISALVYVQGEDIEGFENDIKNAQLSEDLFFIKSLHNQTYTNLKILDFSKATSSENTSGAYYSVNLQEVILVKALTENYKNSKNAGYSNNKNIGSQNAKPVQKKSLALTGLEALKGAF